MLYLWIKAFHVMAVMAWMAGMLYLPRLFVYHCAAAPGSELSETLKLMERRLLRFIVNPAMIASFVFGFWLLALNPALLYQGYMHIKLAAVLAMAGVHGYLAACCRKFAAGANTKSARHYRILNEVPTLLMILIVVMIVVRP